MGNLTTGLFAKWEILELIKNTQSYAKEVGGAGLSLIGIVMIIVGGWMFGSKFMKKENQGQPVSWFRIIMLVFGGGVLMIGGFSLLADIAQGGKETIDMLGGGMILFT